MVMNKKKAIKVKTRLALKVKTIVFLYVKCHSQPSPLMTITLSSYPLPKEKGHLYQTIQEKNPDCF